MNLSKTLILVLTLVTLNYARGPLIRLEEKRWVPGTTAGWHIAHNDSLADCFATIVVAIFFCLLHIFNLFTNEPLLAIEVTRAIGCISLFFVVLRTLDLFYC
uniref:Secreted protein n=1 Tax=Caenorhabditis tropicalis TaxID=1561998 RepID=A0A1I7TNH8_9PELO